jgi:DNA-binding transcriptional LysR family regulator
MVTFKQMEAFYWVSKLGSIGIAAKRLATTQSTISKRIQELERVLDVQLFDRTSRAISLTMEGKCLVELGSETLQLQRRISNAVGKEVGLSGVIRIGLTELIAVTSLLTLTSEVAKRHSRIVLEPEINSSLDLYDKLRERKLDLVIGPRPLFDSELILLPSRRIESAWMCNPSLYPGKNVLPLEKIGRYPILIQTDRSGSRSSLLNWLRENRVVVDRTIACNSLLAQAELAAAGAGVAHLSKQYFLPYLKSNRLKIITTSPAIPSLQYYVVYRNTDISPHSSVVAQIAQGCINPERDRSEILQFR